MKTLTAFLFAALLVPTACGREPSNVTGTDQPKPVEQADQGTVTPPPAAPTPPPTTDTTPPAQTMPPPMTDTTPPAAPPATDTTQTPQTDTTPWSATQNTDTGAQATAGASDSLEPKSVNPTDREPTSVDTNTTAKDVDRTERMNTATTDTTITYEQRDSFKDQMRSDLDRIDDKIRDLESRADTGSRDLVAKLKVRRDQLARDLDRVGEQTSAGWDRFQSRVSRDYKSLKRDVENAFR